MGWFTRFADSSLGKKYVMAFTGISLILFLIVHLAGNLTLFFGPVAFNGYVTTLDVVKPIIRVIEVILGLVFLFHIINGIRLWIENKKARPVNYKKNNSSRHTTFFSQTMIYSGSLIFIFLVIHLGTFWFRFNFNDPEGYADSHRYYDIVVSLFQSPIYAGFYILAMIFLGFHFTHGFQSAFQTFGWTQKKYFPSIKKIGYAYAWIMAVGFASLPIYFLFFQGGN